VHISSVCFPRTNANSMFLGGKDGINISEWINIVREIWKNKLLESLCLGGEFLD
jgi:hypothetical protein